MNMSMNTDTGEFDVDKMIDVLKDSQSYDEFRILSDIAGIECIITRDEYESLRHNYKLLDGPEHIHIGIL